MTDEIDTTDPLPPAVAAHAVAKFLDSIKHTSEIDGRYYHIRITTHHGPEGVNVFSATVDASLADHGRSTVDG